MAKNNNFWLKFLMGLGIVLLGFAVGYGILNQKVERNCEDIKEHDAKIDKNEHAIVELSTDVKYLIQGQKDIKVILIEQKGKREEDEESFKEILRRLPK